MTGFRQGQRDLKQPIMNLVHGNIEPIAAETRNAPLDTVNHLSSENTEMTDIGAYPGFSLQGNIEAE